MQYVFMSVHVRAGAGGGQKRELNSPEPALEAIVSFLIGVLETELGSWARTVSSFNCGTIISST